MYNSVYISKFQLNTDYTDIKKLSTDSIYPFLTHKSLLCENHNRYSRTTGHTVTVLRSKVLNLSKLMYIYCYLTKLYFAS